LAVGAFAPLVALWAMWSGGPESPQMRRVGTAVVRTLGFHTLMAVFWLFMYAAAAGVDQALGLGGRSVVLLLVALAIVGSIFYWVVPVLRALVAEDGGAEEMDRWAARAERLMTRFAAATGNARLAEAGSEWRSRIERHTGRLRDLAGAPERARDAVLGSLQHVQGEQLLLRYEKAADDPQSLVRWESCTTADGRRYAALQGHPGAVALAQREFGGNVPLPTEAMDGRMVGRCRCALWPRRRWRARWRT